LLSAERHDRSRVEVIVAYIRDIRDHEFRIAEKARAKGLTFYEIEERRKFDLRVLSALKEIIVKHDINLIHAHDYKTDLFAYLLRLWLRRRLTLLSTAHAWVMVGAKGELYRRLDLLLMRRFDHLIAVSHATKNEMVEAGVSPELISVIHNAIDTAAWRPFPESQAFRNELGISLSAPVVGYVGRIMPEKDLDTWVRAAARVGQQYPDAQFVLIGEGKDDQTLQQLTDLASTLGLTGRVHFPGYRENLLPVYASFDVFFLSSRREGLPNSILEAMALGIPVVTTDVAGAKELVVDKKTGYVFPQGDVENLASAITSLLSNTFLKQQMGRAGRERVENEFSFSVRLRRIEDLYARVLKRPPVQPQDALLRTHG
jgi:glycosyltransferase involved in cell wall biosynthesis